MVAFGLGSNLGDRLGNLREAAARLESVGPVTLRSGVFETEPWGGVEQPFFLNACVAIEADIEPVTLLRAVKDIERDMGRVESVRWGPRKIDIDILLMGDTVFNSPELNIPHINMHLREFVLTPLRQILPGWRHPVTGQGMAEMEKLLPPSAIFSVVSL